MVSGFSRTGTTFGILRAMSAISLKVNGRAHTVDVDPTTPLLYVLSDDLALKGPKFGCGLGQCGSCTAIVNGRAVRSCRTPVSTVNGATIKIGRAHV